MTPKRVGSSGGTKNISEKQITPIHFNSNNPLFKPR